MPDRVHTAVDHVEATGTNAVVDARRAEAEEPQLCPGHQAVLSTASAAIAASVAS